MSRYLFFLLFPLLVFPVAGAVQIDIEEVGSDVVATASGSANLIGLSKSADQSGGIFLLASSPVLRLGSITGNSDWDLYSGASGPSAIGTGTTSFSVLSAGQGSGSGPRIGVSSSSLIFPDGYISGSPIASTSTWLGQSFSTMGLTPGTYSWTWASDSLNITVIPEPRAAAVIVGLLCIFIAGTRKFARSRRLVGKS